MPLDGKIQAYERPLRQEDEVAGVLRRAAQIIRERGHAKMALEDKRGGVCFFGALNVARTGVAKWVGPNSGGTDAYPDALRSLLKEKRGLAEWADWNNAPERTAAEVIAALEGAADAHLSRALDAQNKG